MADAVAFAVARHGCIEHRHHEECEECRNGQTTDNHDAHRSPHFGTFAVAYCHRHHTQDGSERRHQHRTDTAAAGGLYGFVEFPAAFAQEVDVVDKHNAVFHNDTDQHDDTECANHIERTAGNPQGEYHTRECKRNGEHDDKRLFERLKLARHHDVNQHDNQGHKHTHVAKRFLLVFVVAGDADNYTLGNVQFVDNVGLDGLCQLAQRGIVRRNFDGYDTLTALTLDGWWCPIFADGAHFR